MGAKKKTSKSRKPQSKARSKPAARTKAKAKAARKPVKKTPPKPRKAQQSRKQTVVKKPTKSPNSGRRGKDPAPAPSNAKAKPASSPTSAARAKPAEPVEAGARPSADELRRQLVAKARSRTKPQRAVAFTLDDVRGELAKARPARKETAAVKPEPAAKPSPAAAPGKRVVHEIKPTNRRFGAASLTDILGYDPSADQRPEDEEATIDKKYLRYYRLLVQLREHVKSGLALHAEDTLKRSSRDDAGDLSGYGQHMADAGTDAFDRDFALSLVSNEQEALFEIEEAIKRIKNGTYGICELTGKPISKERLLAVPFARYSVESQAEIEKTRRRAAQRTGLFGDVGEEGAKLSEDESD